MFCIFSPHCLLIFLAALLLIRSLVIESKSIDPFAEGAPFDTSDCSNYLPKSIKDKIKSYKTIANKIYTTSVKDPSFKGTTYRFLKNKILRFGPRLSGTANLENALDYLVNEFQEKKFSTNVHTEEVNVPTLVRLQNQAKLFVDGKGVKEIEILGTGFSKSTSIFGFRREILYVPTIKYLYSNVKLVKNKIVVIKDISAGLAEWKFAETSGAKAIVQSSYLVFTRFTINLTSVSAGSSSITIPMGTISHADISLIESYSDKGTSKLELWIKIVQYYSLSGSTSKNIVGDYRGETKPKEFVIISAHADSWDVSPSASDDGVGIAIASQVSGLLNHLNLRPKRTIRTIIWTAEEFGFVGSGAYVKLHEKEMKNLSTVLEVDKGCFEANGWNFGGNKKYGCILNEISLLLKDKIKSLGNLFKNKITNKISEKSSPVQKFFPYKVPGANFNGDNGKHEYYKIHHTKKDIIKYLDSSTIDECLAVVTTVTYVIADLDMLMPRLN